MTRAKIHGCGLLVGGLRTGEPLWSQLLPLRVSSGSAHPTLHGAHATQCWAHQPSEERQ